jgi:transcriptional regulator with XRE-family HTH domain
VSQPRSQLISSVTRLKDLRSRLGISLREVEQESQKIASARSNPEFIVSNHWLTKLENGHRTPSIYTLFSLSAIYKVKFSELLSMFGLDLDWLRKYQLQNRSRNTYLLELEKGEADRSVAFPVSFDPGFRVEATNLISRMVEVWGEVPIALIEHMNIRRHLYGYVGLQDRAMYPLVRPGSFVLIDERVRKVHSGQWRTEWDRPIYFIELRDGYACSWCEMDGEALLLVPHPLSSCSHRRFDSRGAEVVGQVVALASRIVDVTHSEDRPSELPARPTRS